mmetsp:Transcript_17377/g.39665  ORF Transcript_17377/g.39665 Transcript_17377/m.39665 type:complete len:239 (-) Transcript_17377:53-769(-)
MRGGWWCRGFWRVLPPAPPPPSPASLLPALCSVRCERRTYIAPRAAEVFRLPRSVLGGLGPTRLASSPPRRHREPRAASRPRCLVGSCPRRSVANDRRRSKRCGARCEFRFGRERERESDFLVCRGPRRCVRSAIGPRWRRQETGGAFRARRPRRCASRPRGATVPHRSRRRRGQNQEIVRPSPPSIILFCSSLLERESAQNAPRTAGEKNLDHPSLVKHFCGRDRTQTQTQTEEEKQ